MTEPRTAHPALPVERSCRHSVALSTAAPAPVPPSPPPERTHRSARTHHQAAAVPSLTWLFLRCACALWCPPVRCGRDAGVHRRVSAVAALPSRSPHRPSPERGGAHPPRPARHPTCAPALRRRRHPTQPLGQVAAHTHTPAQALHSWPHSVARCADCTASRDVRPNEC